MFARNPFEQVLNTDVAGVDVPRSAPRDMMVDAFLSEIMSRLDEASQHGYTPGLRPDYFGRHREHNGLPLDHGLRGTHSTHDPISRHPARINPFDLGSRGQAFYRPALPPAPTRPVPNIDPFDPATQLDEFGDEFSQFDLDALPGAGTDQFSEELPPFELPPQPQLTSFQPQRTDPGLDALRRAIRPGYASLSTFGYSEPVADPYAENLTALLRRLVRQA